MGCITLKPLQRTKISVPDFRIKHKRPDSDDEIEDLKNFISSCPDEFIQLDLEKNELRRRRMIICGLNVKIIPEKAIDLMVQV